jgi:hypothetical protein
MLVQKPSAKRLAKFIRTMLTKGCTNSKTFASYAQLSARKQQTKVFKLSRIGVWQREAARVQIIMMVKTREIDNDFAYRRVYFRLNA